MSRPISPFAGTAGWSLLCDPTDVAAGSSAEGNTGHPRRWYILGILVLALLVVVLDTSILNVATKTIAQPRPTGLAATHGELQWVIDAYTLVYGGLLLPSGILGDRIGRRRALLIGLVWFAVFSLACAFARNPGQLIAARAALGVGAALTLPATLSLIVSVFPPAERPKAVGTWAGAVGLGIAIGPITGGALLSRFWWGSVFLINLPILALTVAGAVLLIPESRDRRPGRVDVTGTLLAIGGLVLLIYGVIKGGGGSGWTSTAVVGPLFSGLMLLAAFVAHERRTEHPAIDLRYFRNRSFSGAVAVNGLVFFTLTGISFFLVFYLQSVRGYSALQTGLCLLPLAVAQMLFSVRVSAAIRAFGPKSVCTAGMLLVAVCFIGLYLVGADTSIWILEVDLFVLGAGLALSMTPATVAVMLAIPARQSGVGSAINNTFRQIGGSLGVAVLGSILSTVYRDSVRGYLAPLPAPLRSAAAQSIEGTVAVVQRSGPSALGLLGPARDSFVHAMHVTSTVCAAVALAGALVAATLLPERMSGEREPEGVSRRTEGGRPHTAPAPVRS
jgi:EmrB/QacA subfamily drug resistance transporter